MNSMSQHDTSNRFSCHTSERAVDTRSNFKKHLGAETQVSENEKPCSNRESEDKAEGDDGLSQKPREKNDDFLRAFTAKLVKFEGGRGWRS